MRTDNEYAFEQHTKYNKSDDFSLDITGDIENVGGSAGDIMLDVIVKIHMQLNAFDVIGNCFSDSKKIIFYLFKEGHRRGSRSEESNDKKSSVAVGLATCLQEMDNYFFCCSFDKSEKCNQLVESQEKLWETTSITVVTLLMEEAEGSLLDYTIPNLRSSSQTVIDVGEDSKIDAAACEELASTWYPSSIFRLNNSIALGIDHRYVYASPTEV